MAQIETWLRTDQKHVVQVQELDGNLFTADNMANRIGVILTDNGSPITITGGITAYMIRADENTLIMNGASDGNRAWVDLPASAYTKIGPFSVVIKNGTTTIGACTGYMYRSTTDEIVDPGHVIPSIEELLAEIENTRAAGREATAAANTANTAATNANNKAAVAQTAANTANTAASNADNKAAAAVIATGAANDAAAKIDGLVIVITQGDPTLPPSSKLELINGHYRLTISNVKGLKGDTGDAFHITKTYPSVAAMNADYGGTDTAVGDYVMVTSSVEDPDNAKVYIKGSSAWQFVVDMSGATGIKGDTGTGITGASFANDQLTLNFSDGTSYTTPSIRGDKGEPFKIRKTYSSIAAMEADYGTSQVVLDEFVIIQTKVGDVDNGKVYKKGNSAWEFIVQMAGWEGPQGIQGERGPVGPQGIQGERGQTGPGVPAGGTAGQYLRKNSGTDYDTNWESPANNLTTETEGFVLDARQGKVLKDELDSTKNTLIPVVGTVYTGDLNDLTTGRVYTGTGVTNAPTNSVYWFVDTISYSVTHAVQYAQDRNSSANVWTRNKSAGTWKEWKQLALKSDLDEINAILSNLDTHVLTSGTLADIQTQLIDLNNAMKNDDVLPVRFTVTSSSSPFANATYIGHIMRYNGNRFMVLVSGNGTVKSGRVINGTWANDTFYWYELALKSDLADIKTDEKKFSTTSDFDSLTSGFIDSVSFTNGGTAQANLPFSGSASLTINGGGSNIHLICTRVNGEIYTRSKNNGTWDASWGQLALKSDLFAPVFLGNVAGNSSLDITFDSQTAYLVFMTGTNAIRAGMLMIRASSSALGIVELNLGSNITYSTSGLVLTLNDGSSTAFPVWGLKIY